MDHESHVIPFPTRRTPSELRTSRHTCLLVALRPERGLSHALIQHLAAEMPSVAFSLTARPDLSSVWICGYEKGHAGTVEALRRRFPHALLLATGRDTCDPDTPGSWAAEVVEAGADLVLPWPVSYRRLEDALNGAASRPLSRAQGF